MDSNTNIKDNENIINPNSNFELRKEVFEWLEAIIFSLVIVVLIFTFLFRIVGVDGESMLPTLQNGDRLLISDLFYNPKPKDIIVLTDQTVNNKPIIKRIIAVEGQSVDIDFETGTVYINSEVLNEPYIKDLTKVKGDMKFPLTVPNGKVFVLGDNRNNSLDSRYSEIGFADTSDILGRAFFRIYPFNSMGSLSVK